VAGMLNVPVHDGAGAVINGADVVFGGGSPKTFSTVQAVPTPAAGLVDLPQPRSDATSVTIGRTTYLVGGYDGTNPTADVLATTDGRTYQAVAHLPTPVRYPAIAAVDGIIYVFGGQSIDARQGPLDVIQRVDPRKGTAVVMGHLPIPLQGAAAAAVDGRVYLAGGDSSSPTATTVGMGTTQLSPAPAVTAAGVSTNGVIWEFAPATGAVEVAGRLQVPVSHAGIAVLGSTAWLVGGESGGTPLNVVQMWRPDQAFGTVGAPGAGSPYFGDKLLVADRGNNRLLLLDAAMNVSWSYPNPTSPPDPLGFYFPDDAFFVNHGQSIISNQEENETIVQIGVPSGAIIWSYGHPKQVGTSTGYLHEPDDAYVLRNGQVTVADAENCRILVINHDGTVASQIGTNGVCRHNPPASMGTPNGDTPLWDGNLLISEITGSWVSEYTPGGTLVWTVHLPLSYPSDPQQLDAGPTTNTDRYLIADYANPGQVLQFSREGAVLATYRETSGPGRLNHPSLAEQLPSGVYMINDDYRHRMVAIDPTTGALVWQYGVNDVPGTAPGMLNTPDGFDVLAPDGSTPTHPQTG
ncbi:MAG: PQQ-binding-like beta-propeller repeat protein, partial [Pseudonocardiaceae bacterium]